MAKRQCKLCANSRRDEIDRFLKTGATFAEFKKRFRIRGLSVYTWSRHKNRHAVDTSNAKARELGSLLDVRHLQKINKRLLTLAVRAERKGKLINALQGYAAISRNIELLAKFEKPQNPSDPQSDLPDPAQLDAGIRTMLAELTHENQDFRSWLMTLMTDDERAAANLTTENRIANERDYREHVRALILEADQRCAPQPPYYETIPTTFPTNGAAKLIDSDDAGGQA